jgi:hypothetical protein
VADNATAEGRARNRRIAITILSEELAGADAPLGSTTNSPALLPAVPVSNTRVPPPLTAPSPDTNGPSKD